MIAAILFGAVFTVTPPANPEVLEPSVLNEVEHALARAPRAPRFRADAKLKFTAGATATDRAIALVSAQRPDGRWLDGTNDVSFAAIRELNRLAYGDGAMKVLMIGNSFSISNCSNLPQVCESLGLDFELGSLYIGGCSLERHWRNVEVAVTNAVYAPYRYDHFRSGKRVADAPEAINIPAALKARRWDIVTIQQVSGLSWRPETFHPWGDELVKLVRQLVPQAEIVVQETWSYTPWDGRFAKWGLDPRTMYLKLREAYAAFAKPYDFRVIPMGTKVEEWRARLPVKYTENSFGGDVCGTEKPFVKGQDGKWRPDGDVFHLNRRGEYFQALVWAGSLFGADMTKCVYKPDFVTPEDAALMKEIASPR